MISNRSLILLTLNEIEGSKVMIPKIPRSEIGEIIAVDGGSTDGTCEFFKENGIRVVDQQSKKGRGEAFNIAVEVCKGSNIVFFSPDGNEDPQDIPKLFRELEQGAPMVIASRFLPGAKNEEDGKLLPFRKWANQGFGWLANVFFNKGPYVSDTINGFRGVQKNIFNTLSPSSKGYSIEYELTIHAMKKGFKIAEIPTLETDRVAGETKAGSIKTGLIFLKLFLRELFSK